MDSSQSLMVLSELITASQTFVRDHEFDVSATSLRDVKRVIWDWALE